MVSQSRTEMLVSHRELKPVLWIQSQQVLFPEILQVTAFVDWPPTPNQVQCHRHREHLLAPGLYLEACIFEDDHLKAQARIHEGKLYMMDLHAAET